MKRFRIILVVLGILSLMCLPAQARESQPAQNVADTLLRISGKVINAVSGEVIREAEVHVVGSNVSTITNEDGYFLLKCPKETKVLTFSALGFHAHSVPVASLSSTENISILLKPSATILRDVSVYSAENIVLAAVNKIVENYPSTQMHYKTFYRETVKKRNRYVSVIEAVQDIYKRPYSSPYPENDKVYIDKGRRLLSERSKDTIAVHVEGGPNEVLYLDLVKNREFLLNEEKLLRYEFSLETSKTLGERPQYVVSFRPSHNVYHEYAYSGLMYIDVETLAFTRIEMSFDCSDRTKATEFMLRRKPMGLRFRPRSLTTVINYYYDGAKSHISYIRNVFEFGCDWKKRGLFTNYVVTSENLVTSREESAGKPSNRQIFHQYDVLDKKVSNFIDPDFWKDYNILEPSESLEHAFRRLIKRQS